MTNPSDMHDDSESPAPLKPEALTQQFIERLAKEAGGEEYGPRTWNMTFKRDALHRFADSIAEFCERHLAASRAPQEQGGKVDLRKALETAQARLRLVGAWLQRNHGTQMVNGVSCEVGFNEIAEALALSIQEPASDPVAWRWQWKEFSEDGWRYTNAKPADFANRKIIEPLFTHPPAPAVPADLVERLNKAHDPLRAHNLYREAASAIASLDRRLNEEQMQTSVGGEIITELRAKLADAQEDITRGIEQEQAMQSRILRETDARERAEAALASAIAKLESGND